MNAALQRLDLVGRTEAVLDALTAFIGENRLQPGDRLPTETQLASDLGVGRSTIREAIRKWSTLGLVEVRKGSGTFLKRPISPNAVHLAVTLDTRRAGLLQTVEIRRGLETEAGALAALRATPAAIEDLEHKLCAMETRFQSSGAAGREDLAFHSAIYMAAGNPLFGQILEGMRDSFERLFTNPTSRHDFASRSFPFHRELFDAIAARDPLAAREKTLAILDIVEEDIREMVRD